LTIVPPQNSFEMFEYFENPNSIIVKDVHFLIIKDEKKALDTN
jgi:hypothetical protein